MGKNKLLERLAEAVRQADHDRLKKTLEGVEFYRDSLREESLLHIGHDEVGIDMVRFLLQHGIDPNEQDEIGDTVLNYAAARNEVDVIRLLLDHGALLDVPNARGEDAFSFACVWDSLEAAELLFAAGSRMTWVKKNWSAAYLSDPGISLPSPRIRRFLLDSKIVS